MSENEVAKAGEVSCNTSSCQLNVQVNTELFPSVIMIETEYGRLYVPGSVKLVLKEGVSFITIHGYQQNLTPEWTSKPIVHIGMSLDLVKSIRTKWFRFLIGQE